MSRLVNGTWQLEVNTTQSKTDICSGESRLLLLSPEEKVVKLLSPIFWC